ncbi:unnamed protein product, partial [Ixodes pacificus]
FFFEESPRILAVRPTQETDGMGGSGGCRIFFQTRTLSDIRWWSDCGSMTQFGVVEEKKKVLRAHLASNGRLAAVGKGLLGLLRRRVLRRNRRRRVDADCDPAILLVVFFRHGREALALLLVQRVLLTSALLFSAVGRVGKREGKGK